MNKLIKYLPLLAAGLIIAGCADSNQSATTTSQGAATNPALGTTTTTDPGLGGTGLGRTGSGGGLGGGGVQGAGGH
ncbi:MAG: hypothetical protein ABI839_07290 [Verrucomicrobiota bacterium]